MPRFLLCAVLVLTATGFDGGRRQPVARLLGKELLLEDLVPQAELAVEKNKLQGPALTAWLLDQRRRRLGALIWQGVFADYSKKKGLEPTKAEIQACARAYQKASVEDPNWSPEDGTPPLELEFAAELMTTWKRDVALHRQFGGRIIFQQFGPEPIDAWRKLLEQYEAEKAFVILDPELRGCVYTYFHQRFLDAGADALAKPLCFL